MTRRMRWVTFVVLAALPCLGQTAQSQTARARAAMQASVARQRASVARQAQSMEPLLAQPLMAAAPMRLATPVIYVPRAVPAPAPQFACPPVPVEDLSDMIDVAAQANEVDSSLVREVARKESAFRPCAVSSKGAEGLMQLMPSTQAMLAVRDPFDARESLMAGAKLLRQLLERYNGDLALALSAYNAGPGRVDRDMAIPEIPETQNYVADILERLEQ